MGMGYGLTQRRRDAEGDYGGMTGLVMAWIKGMDGMGWRFSDTDGQDGQDFGMEIPACAGMTGLVMAWI